MSWPRHRGCRHLGGQRKLLTCWGAELPPCITVASHDAIDDENPPSVISGFIVHIISVLRIYLRPLQYFKWQSTSSKLVSEEEGELLGLPDCIVLELV